MEVPQAVAARLDLHSGALVEPAQRGRNIGLEPPQDHEMGKPKAVQGTLAVKNTEVPEVSKASKGNNQMALIIAGVVICLVCICSFVAANWIFDEVDTPEEYAEEYDGNVEVYREILSLNDCTVLQNHFDIAYITTQNNPPGTTPHHRAVGFMTAADQRMREIGCYE